MTLRLRSVAILFIGLAVAAGVFAQGSAAENGAPTAAPRQVKLAEGPDLGYVAVPDALPLPEGMHYGGVAAVAINSKGHIFVYHRAPVPLIEFDQGGKFLRAFGEGLSTRPHGMRIDAQDNLWITDVNDNTVIKLNPRGETVMTLGTRGPAGEWNEAAGIRRFNQPTDLAFDSNGDVLIAQGHGGPDPRVFRFDAHGKLLAQWSGKVDGPAAFAFPHTIAVGPGGDVYVADRQVKRILVFDRDGKYKRTIQNDNLVCGFYVSKDVQFYMTTGQDGQIEKLDWNGRILAVTGDGPGKALGQYGEAHYMTMDARGDIYVADTQLNHVQKLVKKQ